MRILRLFFFSLICLSTSLSAQENVVVKGIVKDSLDVPLVGATVMMLDQNTDALKGFGITSTDGAFRIETTKEDSLKLRITYIGYGTFDRIVQFEDGGVLDYGQIILREDAHLIDGVTIKESFIPIVIKKDTIEYTADAFNAGPDAVVEDLLKKLPGVEVDREGNIKAQGETVEQVLVDGKTFFDEDPKVATKNIPADIVNKVQVYDDASDFTKFTGIDDGEDVKTINLKIKEGKNKGLFGKVEGAYGADERYAAAVNLNRFTKKMQLSTLSNSNNINDMPFSLMDYLEFTGGLKDIMSGDMINFEGIPTNLLDNSGITTTTNIGLNFNYDFSKNFTLRSNVFFDFNDNTTLRNAVTQSNLPQGLSESQSSFTNTEDLANRRANLKLQHKFDGKDELTLDVSYKRSRNEGTDIGERLSYGFMRELINASDVENDGRLTNNLFSSLLSYRKKLGKKGRSLSLEASYNETDNDHSSNIRNLLTLFEPEALTDTLIQRQNRANPIMHYMLKGSFIEPLGKAVYLSLGYEVQNNQNRNNKIFEDLLGAENYILNTDLSNNFERDLQIHKPGLSFKFVREKWNASLGAFYQWIALNNTDIQSQDVLSRDFNTWLPYARLRLTLAQNTSAFIEYSTRNNIPSIEQLQPVLDNRNILNVYSGNPDLGSEYIHTFRLNYNRFNNFYFRSFFAGFDISMTQDQIVNAEIVDEQLVRTTSPINSGNAYASNIYGDFSSPIPSSNFKLSLGLNGRFAQNNILVNSISDRLKNTSIQQRIELQNKRKKKWDWLLGLEYNHDFNTYNVSTDYNQNYGRYTAYVDLNFDISNTLYFKLAYEREYLGATLFDEARQFDFLDAKMTYVIKDSPIRLYVKGQNLLDQTLNFSRSNSANTYFEQSKNMLGRGGDAGHGLQGEIFREVDNKI